MIETFATRLKSKLQRRAIDKCSKWAERYRMVCNHAFPGPWTFNFHAWLKEMHDADDVTCVGQKAAQMGYTETMLNKTFYELDINKKDCLYVLPTTRPDAYDFSSSRFGEALESSEYIRNIFTSTNNVGHKKAGSANLYIRGSRARSALKSVPVGFIAMDEIEEFTQENVPLAFERLSGQLHKQAWLLSTPSIDDYGINKYFKSSSQDHFYFKSPHTDQYIELTYPECLHIEGEHEHDPKVLNSYIKCPLTNKKIEHEELPVLLRNTGRWEKNRTDCLYRGFYINQLYSYTIKPHELAIAYFMAQKDQAAEQEFYNSKLGLPHVVKGARVTQGEVDQAKKEYTTNKYAISQNKIRTMGIDIGTHIHVEVDEWDIGTYHGTININAASRPKIIAQYKLNEFEELDELIYKHQVHSTVVDAQPERRKALEFAHRNFGHVHVCMFAKGISGKHIKYHEDDDKIVMVDRTSWIDAALQRFRKSSIWLPRNIDLEYQEHIQVPTKIYEKDKDGNPTAKYISTKADHYAFARVYAEIALPLANVGENEDIRSPI